MANAKIISFVNHEINQALNPVQDELEAARQQTALVASNLRHDVEAVHTQTVHAIADNTLKLRHDINHLAAAINQLRRDIDAVIIVVEGVRQDVESLKQGGGHP